MTLTDKLKVLDEKIKANQAQYDLGREAAKISALSSKDLFEKYEYLTHEGLGHRPSVHEKLNLNILHWVCHLVNHFKEMRLKVAIKMRVILIVTATIDSTNFLKDMMNLKICHKILSTIG